MTTGKGFKKYLSFKNKIIILGFGTIGQAVLPLLLRHLQLSPEQIILISKTSYCEKIAQEFGLTLQVLTINKENYIHILGPLLEEGDFLLNLSVGISSIDLIHLCQEKKTLYLDASTEPWDGHYTDNSISPALRTNNALREAVLTYKEKPGSTAVLTHGANPGLVSHFIKQALWNLAKDNSIKTEIPKDAQSWAMLAQNLGIKAIHIAERDTQVTNKIKAIGEFVNTWSVDGFISEASQPAELGWGTHERHWPQDAAHSSGSSPSIYLNRPGANTKVRTWTPTYGAFHGFLITHAESISIANFLTVKSGEKVSYRPTVHYAYLPCPDAILSLQEFANREWQPLDSNRIIVNEIIDGTDELGVLLMGNKKGAYWYGSQLSIQEVKRLVTHNSATTLQVAAGIFSAVIWAIENPDLGVVEPEEMDSQYILDIALPYLGKVCGYYTNWTPLENRQALFSENIDFTDPWQFINIRVN